MSAYDDFIGLIQGNKTVLKQYRRDLISSKGSLVCGKMPEFMTISVREEKTIAPDGTEEIVRLPRRLFIRSSLKSGEEYGFVFNKEGTEKVVNQITNGQKTRIADDYMDDFKFLNDNTKQFWDELTNTKKRRLVSEDIDRMITKTNLQYRIHGDRLHYFVLGKVTIESSPLNGKTKLVESFPLVLFSCLETDRMKMAVEVEQSGFINFWLDENKLDNAVSKVFKGVEVNMGSDLIRDLNTLQQQLSKTQFGQYDKVELDPTFSMIGIVTGFQAEYVDKAWEAMI